MSDASFLWWIVIGLVAGVAGKLILPGRDPGGPVATVLIGIAGAVLSGFVAHAFAYDLGGGWVHLLAATAGAVVLLAIVRLIGGRHPPA